MTTQYQVAGSLISSREAAIRAAIESWAGDTSASEWTEDQIREGLPGWCKAPEGVDQTELDAEVVQTAIAMMRASRTVHCECGVWTGERCVWTGPKSQTVVVEYMPEYLRASHQAAGNAGLYPANGAVRVRVERYCAELLLSNEDERDWAQIVGD